MFKANEEEAAKSTFPWMLIEGENPADPALINCETKLSKRNQKVSGKFYLTNFRLYFKSDDYYKDPGNNESKGELTDEYLMPEYLVEDVPLGLVQKVEKISSQINPNDLVGVLINCKDGQRLIFYRVTDDDNFEKLAYNYLKLNAFPLSNNKEFFAFNHKKSNFIDEGWTIYNAAQEYERMGLLDSKKWRFTDLNKNHTFCETYPALLVVPSSTSDKELELVSEFRSKNRIPVLSWAKPDNRNVAIMRSSQPLCGVTGKRSFWDEMYLKNISDLNETNKSLHIMDARPYINALANCTTGGGYENEKCYQSCKISFLNIENIHAVRDSLNSINEIISGPENSKWLEHIRGILEGVNRIIYLINRDTTVLIHCSDGWDRTAQLTSLSMLMLDKHYRTIQGFEVLIEKEWLSFGHRFETRMGHGSDNHSDHDRSPIFLQFIDCVWQIMQQNENFFEFTEKFLLEIVFQMYACQYGTFLYDSECKREKNEAKLKTKSLWTFINNNILDYYNTNFIEFDGILQFSTDLTFIKNWNAYHSKYKDFSENSQNDLSNIQRTNDSIGNIFENFTPNFLSNGYKLLNHIKLNLKN